MGAKQMQLWAENRIAEAAAGSVRAADSSVQELVDVHLFLQSKRSTLFGMQTTPDAFDDLARLGKLATDALRQWFERLDGEGDRGSQARLWHAAQELGLELGFAEPAHVKSKRLMVETMRAEFDALPNPSASLTEYSTLLATRQRWPNSCLEKFGGGICPVGRGDLCAANFQWCDDDWPNSVDDLDPCFFPIAGGDDDFIGLFLHPLTETGAAPVVWSFHEESPALLWVAEDLNHLDRMFAESAQAGPDCNARVEAARGTCAPVVRALLDYPRYESPLLPEWAATERRNVVEWATVSRSAGDTLERIYASQQGVFAAASLRARKLQHSWFAKLNQSG